MPPLRTHPATHVRQEWRVWGRRNATPTERQLIGYFPENAMRLAAECTWHEYIKATGPSTSNRR